MERVTVRAERIVARGVALARLDDGRRALIHGAMPGEVVVAEPDRIRRDLVEAHVVEVVEASPDRIDAVCPHVAAGCGGCSWQHMTPTAQASAKRGIVVDAVQRIGGLDSERAEDIVAKTIALAPWDYRTSVRVGFTRTGRPGFRKSRSHELVEIDDCPIAAPAIRAVLPSLRADGPGRSGEAVVRVVPGSDDVVVVHDADSDVHTDVTTARLVPRGDADAPRHDLHARVGNCSLGVPASAFFQPHTDGPDALTTHVGSILTDDFGRLADLYCGVGLFAAAIGPRAPIGIEQHRAAARAAHTNLEHLDAVVTRGDVARSTLPALDTVVADPSREGLGADAVSAITRSGASQVVLVSCDPAAFGRDTRLLRAAGFELCAATPFDQFAQTHHVEIVSHFTK